MSTSRDTALQPEDSEVSQTVALKVPKGEERTPVDELRCHDSEGRVQKSKGLKVHWQTGMLIHC